MITRNERVLYYQWLRENFALATLIRPGNLNSLGDYTVKWLISHTELFSNLQSVTYRIKWIHAEILATFIIIQPMHALDIQPAADI